MSKKNPDLRVGDRIKLMHMDGETSVSPLTKGTVISITNDPFEKGSLIINVKWDTGSVLSLLSNHDVYKKISDDLRESTGSGDIIFDYVKNNKEILKNFDWRFFRDYLSVLRKSGVVNMFGSAEFLWLGKESIERYYGEGREENEYFQEVLELADEAKDKLISGSVKLLTSKGKEIGLSQVERVMGNSARKLVELYMSFPPKN